MPETSATNASESTKVNEPAEEDDVIKRILNTLSGLNGPAREAAVMKLAEVRTISDTHTRFPRRAQPDSHSLSQKIKIKILGDDYSMGALITAAIAAKAAPEIHSVIRDECIRLGVGRREYRGVVVRLFTRIRKAIGWKDVKGSEFCPKWGVMKKMMHNEYETGPNKAVHTKKPDWRVGGDGCVWTEVELYLAERLIAYRAKLPAIYQTHLKTILTRVTMVDELVPDMRAAIRVPIDLQVVSPACLTTCTDIHRTTKHTHILTRTSPSLHHTYCRTELSCF